ncbi:MAG: DUF1456 family protein [Bdellovibrionia bacterium]
MTNNDVLRSIRYILNVNETKLIEIIALADFQVGKDDMSSFLKQEEEEGYKNCGDKVLAHFLNGLIIYKRGKDENRLPLPIEISMTNNIILKKVRVAFELKDTDIISLIEKSGLKVSKTELSAFFRNQDHRNYRECGNQFLRNLLRAMAS